MPRSLVSPRPFAASLLLPVVLAAAGDPSPAIPVTFELKEPGHVTLVIEGADGKRVRNLISETPFPAGRHAVAWDGLDDLGRDPEAAKHSVFHIPGKLVAPGDYTVRGLVHPGIDITYQLTPYTNGNPPWNNGDPAAQWLTNHSAPSDVIFVPAGAAPVREGSPSSAGPQLLVCSRVAEGGSGLAWLDMDGNKVWGQHWLGGVWTAASHLAVDRGARTVDGVYAYAAASWPGDKYNDYRSELRLHKLMTAEHRRAAPKDKRFGSGEDRPVLEPTHAIPLSAPLPDDFAKLPEREQKALVRKLSANLTGLAVHDGVVWASFAELNQLVAIDAHAGNTLGTVSLEAPGGLAFDKAGRLHVLGGGKVLRFAIDSAAPLALPEPDVIASGLEDPQDLFVDDNGVVYVSDQGSSHQIKRYAADGRALAPIGEAGGPAIGRFNPNRLSNPAGMTVDGRGRLWVTENHHSPKRVSVWNLADGRLLEAFYGPMRYGGSGAVDPKDPTRFFYDDDHGGGIEFKLDYATGRSTPAAVYYLPEADHTGIEGRYVGGAPSYPLHRGDLTYLTNAYSLHTTGRRSATLWRMDDDGVARIVAAAGSTMDSAGKTMPLFGRDDIHSRLPEGFDPAAGRHAFFVWSDLDGDQLVDPLEIQIANPDTVAGQKVSRPTISCVAVDNDLVWTVANVGGSLVRLTPESVNAAGVPVYDLGKTEVLSQAVQSAASSGGGQALSARDGWTVTTTPLAPLPREAVGAMRDGEPVWSYPSLWPGLHASHIAPMPENSGQLIGTTRVIGNVIDAPPGSDAGQLFAINANKGTIYVFTVDGLFVTRLFQDSRTASWNAPEAIRGMSVKDLSLHEECFGPMWTRADDGRVFLQGGGPGNIMLVENLDRVRRLPDRPLTVTREQLAAAQEANLRAETERQAALEKKPLVIKADAAAPTVDGRLDDWKGSDWVKLDKRTAKVGNWGKSTIESAAAVRIAGDRLYLAWDTYDPDLLRSSGESMNNLFKTGGALDILIGTDASADPARRAAVAGDRRLLVTRVKDRTVAVLYAPVSPGATTEPVVFGSPLRTLRFDRVDIVSDQVELASVVEPDLKKDKNGSIKRATFEVSVPLALLDFKPEAGATHKFDIGLLRGDGAQTLQRVYWSNKASGLVSDIPSEAELIPALWGELKITE